MVHAPLIMSHSVLCPNEFNKSLEIHSNQEWIHWKTFVNLLAEHSAIPFDAPPPPPKITSFSRRFSNLICSGIAWRSTVLNVKGDGSYHNAHIVRGAYTVIATCLVQGI